MEEEEDEYDLSAADVPVAWTVFVDPVDTESQSDVYQWMDDGSEEEAEEEEEEGEAEEDGKRSRKIQHAKKSLVGSGLLLFRDKHGFLVDGEEDIEQQIRVAARGSSTALEAQETWRQFIADVAGGKISEEEMEKGGRGHKKLLELVKECGVPAEHRRRVWRYCLKQKYGYDAANGSETSHRQQNEGGEAEGEEEAETRPAKKEAESTQKPDRRGVYDRILQEGLYEETVFSEQIEKDISRTFPEHTLFDTRGGLEVLGRVLNVFASYSCIGYCQSMNFIAGFCLLVLDEEETLRMLCHIIEDLLPRQFYLNHMLDSQIDQCVFAALIKEKLPALHRHVRKFEMPITLGTSQWFLSLFVGFLPSEVCFRVWDLVLVEGARVLFMVALALLKMNEAELLECSEESQAFTVLRELPKRVTEAGPLLATAVRKYGHSLTMKKIAGLRRAHREEVVQLVEEQVRKRQAATRAREKLAEARRLMDEATEAAEAAEAAEVSGKSGQPVEAASLVRNDTGSGWVASSPANETRRATIGSGRTPPSSKR